MERKLLLKDFLLRPNDVFYMSDTAFSSEELILTPDVKPTHVHDFYEFFIVIEGQITEMLNGTKQSVSEKALRILFPKDSHNIRASKNFQTSKIRNVAIRSDYFEERLRHLSCNINTIQKEISLHYFAYHALMEGTSEAQKHIHDPVKYHFIMANVLDTVLIHACISNQNALQIPLWLERLCAEMQKFEHYTAGLPRMLELSCRSQGHLNRCMKKYFGMTSTEYINTLRLDHAVDLLQSTDKKIVDIAYECGFESVPYFNKIFKKHFVVSPHHYRKHRIC